MSRKWSEERKKAYSDRLRRVWPGQRYGKWTVIEGNKRRSYDNVLLHKCRCDCGSEMFITGTRLIQGAGMCSSCNRKRPMGDGMKRLKSLCGHVFGSWTVLEKVPCPSGKRTSAHYRCRCICGHESVVSGGALKQGQTKQCLKCYHKNKRGQHRTGHMEIPGKFFSSARNNAVRRRGRSLEFSVTIEDLWSQFTKQGRRCALSGVELFFGNTIELGTASLDRIDSSKGYTVDNIQFLHKEVNIMKQDMLDEQLLQWVVTIYKNKYGTGG